MSNEPGIDALTVAAAVAFPAYMAGLYHGWKRGRDTIVVEYHEPRTARNS